MKQIESKITKIPQKNKKLHNDDLIEFNFYNEYLEMKKLLSFQKFKHEKNPININDKEVIIYLFYNLENKELVIKKGDLALTKRKFITWKIKIYGRLKKIY